MLCNIETIVAAKFPSNVRKINIWHFNSTRKAPNGYQNGKGEVDGVYSYLKMFMINIIKICVFTKDCLIWNKTLKWTRETIKQYVLRFEQLAAAQHAHKLEHLCDSKA